ncbi:disks large 3 [Grus japonensis]|uniref:Disks large 3 n=1 Tax=Grus japonensis TaxID=30415 RepID=A0ABC9XCV1_GRUJA
MIRRQDTERALEILTRYQSTLRSPEEQELKASIGKVSRIFQSELFQALLGEKLSFPAGKEGKAPQKLCNPEEDPDSGVQSSTHDRMSLILDIHEFYDFTLRSVPLQSPSPDTCCGTSRQQHGASEPTSTVTPGKPQNLFEDPSQDGEQRLPAGAGDSTLGTPPRLVRVTARTTEAPASVCSLVLGSHSALPQDFM